MPIRLWVAFMMSFPPSRLWGTVRTGEVGTHRQQFPGWPGRRVGTVLLVTGEAMEGFGYKLGWLAIAGSDMASILAALGLRDLGPLHVAAMP